MTQASDIGKTGTQIRARRAGTRLGWPDILAAVQDAAERSALVTAIRDAGFSIDDFANVNKPREIACSWLTLYEDRLEVVRGGVAASERARCRAVRRRLELELFP